MSSEVETRPSPPIGTNGLGLAPAISGADHARAFVEVQNGCDHDCTFCVTTIARGASRSIPAGAIIDAIKGRPGYPGIVDQIRTRMRGKIKAGGQLRFGFRIYRDSVRGGASGVEDEGYPLPEECTGNEDRFMSSFQGVTARDTAVFLARRLTKKSLQEIGEYFGGRDHTTVLHACRKIAGDRSKDSELNQQLHVLEQTLKG